MTSTVDHPSSLLALDFDGCIADSVIEALFVTYSAYRRYVNPDTMIFSNREPRVTSFSQLVNDYPAQVAAFRRARPYIKDASDYAAILAALERNHVPASAEDLTAIKATLPADTLKTYYDAFYAIRTQTKTHNFEAWWRLTPPFPCIHDLRRLTREYHTLIVTTNSRESIEDLLQPEYLDLAIRPDDIIDLHIHTDKRIQMDHVVHEYHVDYRDIHFVDDNLSHLTATRARGVNVYLAGWGYCTQDQITEADTELNIPVLTTETAYATLSAALASPGN